MKLPASWKSVTLNQDIYQSSYPPFGFYSFTEQELGNGDTFGLYWPIGREDQDPVVAETEHDSWKLMPHFSSLDQFLVAAARVEQLQKEWDEDYDEEGFDEEEEETIVGTPKIEDDPHSPAACYSAAREQLKRQNIELAIQYLETAVSVLPEYGEAQILLCAQYRRSGQEEEAIKAAIQAIISPPCFGARPVQHLKWLKSQTSCPEEFVSDPIWLNREKLTLIYGGEKQNDDYAILRDVIEQYLEQKSYISGMTLMQCYAELMTSETISFQERNDFNLQEFTERQRKVAEIQNGKSRVLELPE